MADNGAVMYAGEIIESGSVDDIFYQSAHPYTVGLRSAMPSNTLDRNKQLLPIAGSPPDLFSPPKGCGYYARCPYAMVACRENPPDRYTVTEGQHARCWLHHGNAPQVDVIHQVAG